MDVVSILVEVKVKYSGIYYSLPCSKKVIEIDCANSNVFQKVNSVTCCYNFKVPYTLNFFFE